MEWPRDPLGRSRGVRGGPLTNFAVDFFVLCPRGKNYETLWDMFVGSSSAEAGAEYFFGTLVPGSLGPGTLGATYVVVSDRPTFSF